MNGSLKQALPLLFLALLLIIPAGVVAEQSTDTSTTTTAKKPATSEGWILAINGCYDTNITEESFHQLMADHAITYTDTTGDRYEGLPLRVLIGLADDPAGENEEWNATRAEAGYSVLFRATDWHEKIFSSGDITGGDGFLVAVTKNGEPLPVKIGDQKIAPLFLTGRDVPENMQIGNIMNIFLEGKEISGDSEIMVPAVQIIRYENDGTTIKNQTTVDCAWMRGNLPIVGDDTATYAFQGPTFDILDLWNPTEDKNLGKVEDIVKGTDLADLCDLVGGMQPGYEMRMTATDGYVVDLQYENIYKPMKQQGPAILAWWTEKQGFVPEYSGGPALFFLADDQVFGNIDMKECMDPGYWRFYWCEGTEYPSAAGLAVRNVKSIEIFPVQEEDWHLVLDGHLSSVISKKGFEQGLACGTRARGHLASWTDPDGHVWTGMPLYMPTGWVDDDCQHDENQVDNKGYNTSLAEQNAYTIEVIGADGRSVAFMPSEVMRNGGYILANKIDNHTFDPESEYWPLTVVGSEVSESRNVNGATAIRLNFTRDLPENNTTSVPTAAAPLPVFVCFSPFVIACGLLLWRKRNDK